MTSIKSQVRAKFGHNISTDDMTSGKFLGGGGPEALAKICFHDFDPDFPAKMAPGGILVGGKNFGCGSSRESAPIALKACNVKAVLAGEYARIFYRNSINIGLPVLECKEAYDKIDLGDEVEIEIETGVVRNLTKGATYEASPIPEFLMDKIEAGGLLEILREQAGDKKKEGQYNGTYSSRKRTIRTSLTEWSKKLSP
jgi:3-isopropylmalate/(R)-2-methylmalate dehydratase small subunit